ncbi:L-aspartate oxidase [Rhodothalassium salexigens DSM 2132]|uniref:L-aspartate oxidase n=1 Tax=Rhodothalassium salexigens DSM 2132 TaxID=1188247 RepID=A0A4R2PLC1_RHOSA|nr:L-aspartate oxidase [Rhodothalassium salexigens]MBB4210939.1 L-aspartate oxidase [Rhodothalassium salexigens DSM 2132]MBK1639811.1 L-aspartate oxidase [Rhodothalassium salexigens DSM 2132]TCP36403.1 L-aspartate oxidase [Rhodothalassium salexigens DSM 2132]
MGDETDVLVIGSGAAGLTVALTLPAHVRVTVISKGRLSDGSTNWAQGGIAAVLEETDSIDSHIHDTLVAGAGLCHEDTVRFVVERGRRAIEGLISRGVPFTASEREDGYGYHLTREGGHSHRRIIHVADATGKAVQKTLQERAAEAPNIDAVERHVAVDLVTNRHLEGAAAGPDRCHGAYVLDRTTGRVRAVRAKAVVLATGGASRVYMYSSNPDGATGDGIALGWRAGCRVGNMEFNQFHPTCLYHPEAKNFLITEALRGEGAILTLPSGERFMPRIDPRAELAPRDVVARAIDHEMKRLGLDHVLLDISHKDPDFIVGHFPNIYRRLRRFGIDITERPIPVVPAAHYTCGGVVTDFHARTDLTGLYAVGECAHTGLHGANRMASNSLLECLVFGTAAAEHIAAGLDRMPAPAAIRPWDESRVTNSDEEVVVTHNWSELRRAMWNYVGIVRTQRRLERAKRRIDMLADEIDEYYGNFRITADLLELRNLVTVADLIVRSALARRESRGLHYIADFPERAGDTRDTILSPTAAPLRAAGTA